MSEGEAFHDMRRVDFEREQVERADEIEMVGARRAYDAEFGASEWAAFLSAEEWDELCALRAAGAAVSTGRNT